MKYEVEFFDRDSKFRIVIVEASTPQQIPGRIKRAHKKIHKIHKYRPIQSNRKFNWIKWEGASNDTHTEQLSLI